MSRVCKHSFERKSNNVLADQDDNEAEVCRLCGKDRNDVIHARKGQIHGFAAALPEAATKDTLCIHCSEVRAHELHWFPHFYVSSSAWRNAECATCGLQVGAAVHTATPANPLVSAADAKVHSSPTDSAKFAFDFLQGVTESEIAKLGDDSLLISLSSGLERLSQDCKFFLGHAGALALTGHFTRLLAARRVAGNKFASMLIHVAAAAASQHLAFQNQNEFKGETVFEISILQALKLFVEIEPFAIDMFAKLGARAPYFCISNYLLTRVCFSDPMSKILSPEAQHPFGNNALSVVFIVLRFVLFLGTKPKIESGNFSDANDFVNKLNYMDCVDCDDQQRKRKFPEYVDGIVKDLQPERLVEPIHKIVRLAVIRPACPVAYAGNFVPVLGIFKSAFHTLAMYFNQLPSNQQLVIDKLSHQYTGFWLTALEAVDSIDILKALWTEAFKNYTSLGICYNLQDIAYLLWQSTNDSSLRLIAFSVFNDEKGKFGPLPFPSPSVLRFFAVADDITNPVYEQRHFKLLQEWTEIVIKAGSEPKRLFALFEGIAKLAPAGSERDALLLKEPCRILVEEYSNNSKLLNDHLELLLGHTFPSANGELTILMCKKIAEVYGLSSAVNPEMLQALSLYASNAVFVRMVGLLDDKRSAKIRDFLATRKIDDPTECDKLFKKIQEIQVALRKKQDDRSAVLMDKFATAREFLVASLLDAHKISDDAAQLGVVQPTLRKSALDFLLRWCDENSKNPELLRDVEQAVADLEQNADQIREIFKNFEKFDWFRLACSKHGISFPEGDDYQSVIDCLESERVISQENFQSLGHSTLELKFPAGLVAPLRRLQRCLSCRYLENTTAQKAFDQLRHLFDQKCVILHPSNLKKGEQLERGGYGVVFTATIITQRNMPCAAKYIKWRDAGDANEEAFKELRNYDGLSDDHISHLIGASVEDSDNPHIIILTKLASCNLLSFLEKFSLSVSQARNFSLEIARGIAYLHSNGIIHSDLKPKNILVFREKYKTSLRLCDFGSVHRLESSNSHLVKSKVCSTENYMPPETVLSPQGQIQVTRRNDIFAFGVILLQMISPRWFGNGGWKAIANKIDSLQRDQISGHLECCIDIQTVTCATEELRSSGLFEIAQKCLMIDPNKRWQVGDELVRALGGADEEFNERIVDAGAAFGGTGSSDDTSARKNTHSVSVYRDDFHHPVEGQGTRSVNGQLHAEHTSVDQGF